MKNLLYIGIILMFGSCGPNKEEIKEEERIRMEVKEELEEEKRIEEEKRLEEEQRINRYISSTIKIGNLEVMTEDLGEMNWYDAMKACADFGDGWRLPTKDELNILYENQDKIGGFANNYYWSSTEYDSNGVWGQRVSSGYQNYGSKGSFNYVRAVRAF